MRNNIRINNSFDKGISMGENSYGKGINLLVENSNIGIASKDKSRFIIDNLKLMNNKIDLMAFQKKSEFGGGRIEINNYLIEEKKYPNYLLEMNSEIRINGETLTVNDKNIKSKFYE